MRKTKGILLHAKFVMIELNDQGLTNVDIAELLGPHGEARTDDLLLIEEQRKRFCDEEFNADESSALLRKMTAREMKEANQSFKMNNLI
uniref:Uncharacterized protein n=1 Tax=Arion vulgaris TaxID=1028688 RepID=A0A0B6ZVH2_9EUPU